MFGGAYYQSRSQIPQAFLSVVGRLERLWDGIEVISGSKQ